MAAKRAPRPVVIEGVVYPIGYQAYDLDPTGDRNTVPLCGALYRLRGKRVRVSIEVLPEGASDANG